MTGNKVLKTVILSIISVTLADAESLPSPTKIRVTDRTKTSFTVQWEQTPSQVYEDFSVKISPNARLADITSPLSRTYTNLRPGTEYTLLIQGFTETRFSSKILRYVVWTVPEEPSDMRLSSVHEIAISISIMGMKTQFTALVDGMEVAWTNKDSSISGYDLQVIPDEGVIVSSEDDTFSGTAKRIITGLTPGKEYSVALRSRVGPDYDPVYSEAVTGKLRMPPAIPYSAEVVESDPTTALLKTHGPLEGIYDELDFDLTPNHGSVGQPTPDPIYPMFELYSWRGLKPGTSYTLDIYAMSHGVKGYKPKTITFTTSPAAPLRLRVDDFGHYSVTLQWVHAHKFADLDEVQYVVEFFKVPDGSTQIASVKNFKRNQPVVVEVPNLVPGTVYNFDVYTIINGVKGKTPASVIQTTIPMKPVLASMILGNSEGIELTFGQPKEGECPSVKTFYSPSLTDTDIKPTFHQLGEKINYPEFPTNGQYKVHARCVSQNVEGPELLITPGIGLLEDNPKARNDEPDESKKLPCSSLVPGIVRPDTIAPDACCGNRPYNSEQRECCGSALLLKDGDRLCCGETPYNKRFGICCSTIEGMEVKLRRDGCPTSP